MINIHGGGAQTNINGLAFEQETKLNDALIEKGCVINDKNEVYYNNKVVGFSVPQTQFSKLIKNIYGYDVKDYVSKGLRPDEALINIENNTCYIIEKKFQTSAGSVDEKIQTAPFKIMQYNKMLKKSGLKVKYCYVMNDWFKKSVYTDVLAYIEDCGAQYFFNKLPLNYLQLNF